MFVSENVSCRKNATKMQDVAELKLFVGDVIKTGFDSMEGKKENDSET